MTVAASDGCGGTPLKKEVRCTVWSKLHGKGGEDKADKLPS